MKKILTVALFISILTSTYLVKAEDGVKVYNIGNVKISVLEDMPMFISPDVIVNINRATLKNLLPDNSCKASLNTYVVEIDNVTYLIDTGLGISRKGKLIEKLKATGYEPSDIKNIILTHMHSDHFGGLVAKDGSKVYQNATLYIAKPEYEFWIDKSNIDKVPDIVKTTFDVAIKLSEVYEDSISLFDLNKEVASGILSIATVGHTPFHTSFEIPTGSKERVIIMGDIVHCLAVQIVDPTVTLLYDYDSPAAINTRIKLFERVAKHKILIMGSHIPFPGAGYIEKPFSSGMKYKFTEKK